MFYQECEQHYLRRKSSSRQSDEPRFAEESDGSPQESVARNESEAHLAPKSMFMILVFSGLLVKICSSLPCLSVHKSS